MILALAVAAAGVQLWAAGVSPFTALVQRPAHLLFMALLGLLGVSVTSGAGGSKRAVQELGAQAGAGSATAAPDFASDSASDSASSAHASTAPWKQPLGRAWTGLLIAGTIFTCVYIVLQHEALVRRTGAATPLDLVAGAIAIVVVLELARRVTGWGIVVVALAALAYAWAGPYLPGILAHRGYSPRRIIEHLYLGSEGVWGIPLGVSADFVYAFVLFGALLEAAGGGSLLIALAAKVSGRMRGAPAMTATAASALMGSISGSAVANAVTTGAFTIPLMKRAGFKPHFAAAIEAAASTGGQMMPPVMGAGAFILATWTGIPYAQVAVAAIVPALLYYFALLAAIHFRAVKMNLPRGSPSDAGPVLDRIHLIVPLFVIVGFLAAGRSPMRAAFWAVISVLVLATLRRNTRLGPRALLSAIVAGAASTVPVAAACATAGIVVGVASLTGIGLRMSELIVTLSGGNLLGALVLTAFGSLVLGTGLPTTAAYVVLAALGAPALVSLGAPLLAAHLFIFYFGCISNVTPPVALAAYAAAGIANASPSRAGWTAMALAATGFIVPFMFVLGPPLLLIGDPLHIAFAILTSMVGVTGLAAAVIGHARRPLAIWQRVLVALGACMLMFPGWLTDSVGFVILAVFMLRAERHAPLESAQEAAVP